MSLHLDTDIARPELSRMAAALFTQRQRKARELVRSGRMDPATATRHLRPWLAIACRCGADLPDLAEGLSDRRTVQIAWFPGDRRHGGAADISPVDRREVTENEARALLADEICPRSHWAPVLAKARDEALLGPLATEDQRANARALSAIARHLAFDPNGRHPVPLFDAARAYPAQIEAAA